MCIDRHMKCLKITTLKMERMTFWRGRPQKGKIIYPEC